MPLNFSTVEVINMAVPLNFAIGVLLVFKSIADTFGAFAGFPRSTFYEARVFLLLIPFLGKRRVGKPWGVVYDAVTKKPIDPAIVTIATRESGVAEFKETRITDLAGRFSFLVTPGKYQISVEKTNYRFPSQVIKESKDGKFENIYHGEIIEVENPYIINLNIPMDPVGFDWNQSVKGGTNFAPWEFLKRRIRSYLIGIGMGICVYAQMVLPSNLNLVAFAIYLLGLLFFRVGIQKELWGEVYDKATKRVLPRVVVKAIRLPHNITAGQVTSDHLGRYFLLMAPGKYKVQVEGPQEGGGKSKVLAEIDNVRVSKGKPVINFDIWV